MDPKEMRERRQQYERRPTYWQPTQAGHITMVSTIFYDGTALDPFLIIQDPKKKLRNGFAYDKKRFRGKVTFNETGRFDKASR